MWNRGCQMDYRIRLDINGIQQIFRPRGQVYLYGLLTQGLRLFANDW